MPTRKREAKRHNAFIAAMSPEPVLILTEPTPPLGSIQVQIGKTVFTAKHSKRQIELLRDEKSILRNIFVIQDGVPKWVSVKA